jgi:hypothetical protein
LGSLPEPFDFLAIALLIKSYPCPWDLFLSDFTTLKNRVFCCGILSSGANSCRSDLRFDQDIMENQFNIDIDCKDFSNEDILAKTNSVLQFLKRNGMHVEVSDKVNTRRKAFLLDIYLPEFLFELGFIYHIL